MGPMRELAERLIDIPGVVAVTLGGPHAGGPVQGDSDWHFGLYYGDVVRADDVRALGFEGTVVEPGEWGLLANGGARLRVEGQPVELLYRDLDVVQHWLDEAEARRYVVDHVQGYLAGMASYVLVGELTLAEVLAGELPRPGFPDGLRRSASPRWRRSAACSLAIADTAAERHDVVSCAGLLAKGAIEAAQAALAERGEWALNEKGIVRRARLGTRVEGILAAPRDRPFELARAVTAVRAALGIPPDARRASTPDRGLSLP
jgi:hypothetical protein